MHVDNVEIHEPILIDISEGAISTPTTIPETCFLSDVFESSITKPSVENAVFCSFRKKVTGKRIRIGFVVSATSLILLGILPYIGHKQVKDPVVVVVPEHGP